MKKSRKNTIPKYKLGTVVLHICSGTLAVVEKPQEPPYYTLRFLDLDNDTMTGYQEDEIRYLTKLERALR